MAKKIKLQLKQLYVATFLGVVVLPCMRICTDVYRNVKYWEVKSPGFIAFDVIATIVVCYVFLYILGWWTTLLKKKQV